LDVINGSQIIYSADRIAIKNERDEVVYRSDSKILALAASTIFRLIVFSTSAGKVRFLNMPNGRSIAVMETGYVSEILITPRWGFVLLASAAEIRLHDVNGAALKSVQLTAPVVRWVAFASPYGFDYVAFADANQTIRRFEAFYPEVMTEVGTFLQTLALGFDASTGRMTVLTGNGFLHLIPCTFTPPADPP
jgi:hypothetical protein